MPLSLVIGFLLKHFVCDFPLQRHYQLVNKGRYGHPGGLLHAGIHAAGTLILCALWGLPSWLALLDAVAHYHIDWAKSRLLKHYKLTTADEGFWFLFGLDQLLHYLTYVGLVAASLLR